MGNEQQWYTNKELFEQINGLKNDFLEFRNELQQTRTIIKKYNGLREELGEVKVKINEIEAKSKGKKAVAEGIRSWGGWIFAFITLLVLLYKTF